MRGREVDLQPAEFDDEFFRDDVQARRGDALQRYRAMKVRVGPMFFIPRVNVIESDEGFSVEVLGRTGLRYRQGDRSLKVDSEVLMGPTGMQIDGSSIRSWEPPHEKEFIDDARRKQIVENIRAAFRFRGFEIEVVWRRPMRTQ